MIRSSMFCAVFFLVIVGTGCSLMGERRICSDTNLRELEFIHHAVDQKVRQGQMDEEKALELQALYDLVKEAYVTYAKAILIHFKFKSSAGAIKSVVQTAADVERVSQTYLNAVNETGIMEGGD